jgi:hypothetical protein
MRIAERQILWGLCQEARRITRLESALGLTDEWMPDSPVAVSDELSDATVILSIYITVGCHDGWCIKFIYKVFNIIIA